MNTHISTAITISGYLALAIGAALSLMSKVKNDNLSDLKDRVDILEKELKYAHNQHVDNQKAISNLEGQLQTYKEIPLKSIANSLEKLAETTRMTEQSNSLILETLRKSAVIAETPPNDGGLLVKTKRNNPLSVEVKGE